MRLDPVRMEEFRSCLSGICVSYSKTHRTRLGFALPEYRAPNSAADMDALLLTDVKELPHSPHMKLDLGRHPKASLEQGKTKNTLARMKLRRNRER